MIASNCGSDDGGNAGPENDLTGVWTIVSVESEFAVGDKSLFDFLNDAAVPQDTVALIFGVFESEFVDFFVPRTIEFKSNSTYISTFGGNTDQGTWTLSGSTLTIDGSTTAFVAQVETLNASTLVLFTTTSFWPDLDGDGSQETVTANATVTFNR